MMTRKRLLVVAHAPSANIHTLLDAVVRGARSAAAESVEVAALGPFQAGPEDVLAAGAIILGTPENLGYMSGALKDFFDRICYPCLERAQGLCYALFVHAGTTAPAPSGRGRHVRAASRAVDPEVPPGHALLRAGRGRAGQGDHRTDHLIR